jgi:hypothetical protein
LGPDVEEVMSPSNDKPRTGADDDLIRPFEEVIADAERLAGDAELVREIEAIKKQGTIPPMVVEKSETKYVVAEIASARVTSPERQLPRVIAAPPSALDDKTIEHMVKLETASFRTDTREVAAPRTAIDEAGRAVSPKSRGRLTAAVAIAGVALVATAALIWFGATGETSTPASRSENAASSSVAREGPADKSGVHSATSAPSSALASTAVSSEASTPPSVTFDVSSRPPSFPTSSSSRVVATTPTGSAVTPQVTGSSPATTSSSGMSIFDH